MVAPFSRIHTRFSIRHSQLVSIVDPSIGIVETSLPGISVDEGNALVLSLKPALKKSSESEDGPGVSF